MRVLVLVLLASTGLAACNCTLAGCMDGVNVDVFPSDPLPVGEYALVVEGASTSEICTFRITDVCVDLETCVVPDQCERFNYYVDGDVVQPNIRVETEDPELTVTMTLDGGEIFEEEVVPAYRESAPNGKRCGPVCTYARVELDVDTSGL